MPCFASAETTAMQCRPPDGAGNLWYLFRALLAPRVREAFLRCLFAFLLSCPGSWPRLFGVDPRAGDRHMPAVQRNRTRVFPCRFTQSSVVVQGYSCSMSAGVLVGRQVGRVRRRASIASACWLFLRVSERCRLAFMASLSTYCPPGRLYTSLVLTYFHVLHA